jgi:muramidase (phage lysozyme)
MKNFMFIMIAFMFFACNQSASKYQVLQKKVDSLQSRLDNSYKPGLGEFMSQIQIHHAKLWFAGKYKNWELAGFEVGEIQEALDDIPKYCADRPEVKSISMVIPAMDSLSEAIKENNENKFSDGFTLLTATCNDCHKATDHGFNVIKIPDVPPVTNQVFKLN